jgi:hypothetical protein
LNYKNYLDSFFKKHKKLTIGFTGSLIFLLIHLPGYSQGKLQLPDSLQLNKQVDIFDVLRKWTGKATKPQSTVSEKGVKNLSLLPIVGYTPANGFVVGGAISVTEFWASPSIPIYRPHSSMCR